MNANQLFRMLRPLLRRRGTRKWAMLAIGCVVAWSLLQPVLESRFGIALPRMGNRSTTSKPVDGSGRGELAIVEAFAGQQSDVIVQCDLVVFKLLRDDNTGHRHQKLLARLPNHDHTVLIAHNIDLADRVPVQTGETITVKGEYEYNDEGGVVHWTHHDPQRRRAGGWIEHEGKRYE